MRLASASASASASGRATASASGRATASASGRATGRAVRWASRLAAAVVAVVVVGALASCSGSGSGSQRDDRSRVSAAIEGFGARLVGVHDIASAPAAVIGACQSAGWAAVSWSAPLTQHSTDPLEQENNVIGIGGTSPLRLDSVRILDPPAPHEPAAIYATRDGHTQVTLTVTAQRTVRVDGYASCPAGKG